MFTCFFRATKKADVKKLENPEIRAQFTETTEQYCFKEYLSKADNDQAEETSESLWSEYKAILSETRGGGALNFGLRAMCHQKDPTFFAHFHRKTPIFTNFHPMTPDF